MTVPSLLTGAASATFDQPSLERWGEAIGRGLGAPAVLALNGDLGAGKSTLARAIARGAGIAGPVPSPTYNLLFRYTTPRGVDIAHLDLYRLECQDDVWELGWAELGAGNEIVLIEWAENAASLLPEPRWEITLEETDADTRGVRLFPVGSPSPLPGFPAPEGA